ncbi:hypothetical protein AVDCRST_MAG94-7150 [uncultured Leptolyngbya sp.]|uniref:Uncharacterized protein n=1 Tax=uncultured Leptolyngbya sp. TaxID=332963 RepID=A0A6J4PZ11_9CYAN|nr:hypothetical protein AVDCRST_MAG94-7150 [uncultured Leptolyngbya sp.]
MYIISFKSSSVGISSRLSVSQATQTTAEKPSAAKVSSKALMLTGLVTSLLGVVPALPARKVIIDTLHCLLSKAVSRCRRLLHSKIIVGD